MPATKGDFLLPQFLKKVIAILNNEDSTIVHWNESGEIIVIENIDLFSDYILPKYYKATKFNSFIRQLNLYGFKKSSSSTFINNKVAEFSHPYFKRGNEDLLRYIKKKKVVDNDGSNSPVLNESANSNLLLVISNLQQEILNLKNELRICKQENNTLKQQLSQFNSELQYESMPNVNNNNENDYIFNDNININDSIENNNNNNMQTDYSLSTIQIDDNDMFELNPFSDVI